MPIMTAENAKATFELLERRRGHLGGQDAPSLQARFKKLRG
jgi:hypothetical protein